MADPQIDYAALAAEHGGAARSDAPPPPSGTWEDRGIAGQVWHPTVPPAAERVDRDVVGGLPLIGGISPEMAVTGAVGMARAAAAPAANVLGRAYAIAKSAGDHVTPQIKYEVTKSGLQAVGVPAPLAMAAALAVSGYRRGTKAAPADTAPSGPHLDRSVQARPSELTQQQLGERIQFGSGTPPPPPAAKPMVGVTGPPASPVASDPVVQGSPIEPATLPSGSPPLAASAPSLPAPIQVGPPAAGGTLPDQKALNEAALAARRAAYQQRLAAQSPAPPYVKPAPLTADETIAFTQLLRRMPGAEAIKTILAQRELATKLGTLSNADVAAEIANRIGNRSPKR